MLDPLNKRIRIERSARLKVVFGKKIVSVGIGRIDSNETFMKKVSLMRSPTCRRQNRSSGSLGQCYWVARDHSRSFRLGFVRIGERNAIKADGLFS